MFRQRRGIVRLKVPLDRTFTQSENVVRLNHVNNIRHHRSGYP